MENMGRILRSKFPRENLHEYQEMLRQLAQDKEIQQFIMQAEVPDAQAFIATNASKNLNFILPTTAPTNNAGVIIENII